MRVFHEEIYGQIQDKKLLEHYLLGGWIFYDLINKTVLLTPMPDVILGQAKVKPKNLQVSGFAPKILGSLSVLWSTCSV